MRTLEQQKVKNNMMLNGTNWKMNNSFTEYFPISGSCGKIGWQRREDKCVSKETILHRWFSLNLSSQRFVCITRCAGKQINMKSRTSNAKLARLFEILRLKLKIENWIAKCRIETVCKIVFDINCYQSQLLTDKKRSRKC